eukprot:m.194776 g.194776  ORF g.194776 m.194776 type:complete len:125 (-) comp10623_c0_seq2:4-378(-)
MSCAASRALLLLLLLAVVAAPCVAHRRRHRHQHAEAAAAPALLRAARSTTEQPPCPPRSLRHATEAARTLVSNLIDDHIRDAYCMMTAEFQVPVPAARLRGCEAARWRGLMKLTFCFIAVSHHI